MTVKSSLFGRFSNLEGGLPIRYRSHRSHRKALSGPLSSLTHRNFDFNSQASSKSRSRSSVEVLI